MASLLFAHFILFAALAVIIVVFSAIILSALVFVVLVLCSVLHILHFKILRFI